jgi:ABC-type polysaccharide/polyol phosphate transport system ATPase subunit
MYVLKLNKITKSYILGNSLNLKSIIFNSHGNNKNRSVLALEDVTFNISKGEAFAVIGRNGSGKSTLLQIIAGTLKQTSGDINKQGRISALLELGSGFNPEFTGLENIYLTGSILGISRENMDLKLPDILAFADIGDFIYEPVRTYSSGMLMRVAFSVAIAVDPDLLIIDEALSVGDILFQQKCNARLKQIQASGVSLLVVTHDTSFVLNMCQRALWLHKGVPMYLGSASDCVQKYLAAMASEAGNIIETKKNDLNLNHFLEPSCESLELSKSKIIGDREVYIDKAWLLNDSKKPQNAFIIGQWCSVYLKIKSNIDINYVSAGCEIRDRHGQVVFATGLRVIKELIPHLKINETRIVKISFQLNIVAGQYTLDVGCGAGEGADALGSRVIAASIIDIITKPEDDIVHGLVKLPYRIEVA